MFLKQDSGSYILLTSPICIPYVSPSLTRKLRAVKATYGGFFSLHLTFISSPEKINICLRLDTTTTSGHTNNTTLYIAVILIHTILIIIFHKFLSDDVIFFIHSIIVAGFRSDAPAELRRNHRSHSASIEIIDNAEVRQGEFDSS